MYAYIKGLNASLSIYEVLTLVADQCMALIRLMIIAFSVPKCSVCFNIMFIFCTEI